MAYKLVFCLLLSLLIGAFDGVNTYAQVLQNNDPSLFHFGSSTEMMSGNYKGIAYNESCLALGNNDTGGKVTSIKYRDFIYVAWMGVTGSVNVACLGSTHLKELAQDTVGAVPNIYHGYLDTLGGFAYASYSPTIAVYEDKLFVFYNDSKDENRIHYLTITREGTVQIADRGVLPGSPTNLLRITAIPADYYKGILLLGSDGANHIRAWVIGKRFPPVNFPQWGPVGDVTLNESCVGTVGVCEASTDELLIAWTGQDANHHLNTAFLSRYELSLRDKFTHTDHSSTADGPVLFRKDNPDDTDVHILWRGLNEDTQIWQGVINLANKNQFSQHALPKEIAVSRYSPTLISLNKLVTYMFWPNANTGGQGLYANIMIAKGFDYGYQDWMGTLLKDEHTLKNMVLPGSHNAGMNVVEQATQIPFAYKPLNLPTLSDCNACGFVTQSADVKGQLEFGYRYFGINLTNTKFSFDKRFFFDDGNLLHNSVQPVDHLTSICLGEGFENMLDDTREFLKNHPGEFVIFNIKDLNASGLSTHSIIDNLREVMPRYADLFYRKNDSEKTFADLINKPIGAFRAKVILTVANPDVADELKLLQDIFEASHDNPNRYVNTTNANVDHLVANQKTFFSNPAYTGSYKRLDWQISLTFNKIACDLNPLKECMEKPKPGFWHHVFHIVGCAGNIYSMGKTVINAFAEPEDLRNWATIIGWGISAFGTSSLNTLESANRKLYPTVYDMKRNGLIRNDNRVNIIYTEASDYLYTDLCLQLMMDFNEYDEMNIHNGTMQLTDEHIGVSCDAPNSGVASVQVHGGHAPYTYYWVSTGDTTATTTGLTEGHHRVRVTDAMGHTVTRNVYVPMNPNAHSGLARVSMRKTEVQPFGLSNHYEQDCDNLIARVQSNYATTAAMDTLTTAVWIDSQQNAYHVKRHYELIPARNAANATATITLYFTQAEFDAFNAIAPAFRLPRQPGDSVGIRNVMIWFKPGKSNDGSGALQTYPDSTRELFPRAADVVWNTLGERWEITFHTQGFGAYFLTTYDGQQKNQWLRADAYFSNGKALVQWQVEEKEVSKYTVEYSYDRTIFAEAGQVKSQGRGRYTYEFYHQNLPRLIDDATGTIVYYRVRQVLNNGETTLSEILPVNYAKDRALYVYPNPVANELTIRSNVETTGKVYSLQGKIIDEISLKKGNNTFSTSSWSAGMYVLRAANGDYYKIVKAQP